jgi:uncharacterized protein (TIGR02001 family)
MPFISPRRALCIALSFYALPSLATETTDAEPHAISGSVSVVNKYIYRGGEENDDVTLQGGVQYDHQSGVFAGYWGSMLGYDPTDETQNSGFEHDVYIGYAGQLDAQWSYSSQVTAYIYQGGGSVYNDDRSSKRRTTGIELNNTLNYKDLSLGLGVLLSDVNYGNAGDVYVSAGYQYVLPYDVTAKALVAAYIYNDHGDDDFVETRKSFRFNEARLGLSKALGSTGADVFVEQVWGGKDRMGEKFDNPTLVGLNYNF